MECPDPNHDNDTNIHNSNNDNNNHSNNNHSNHNNHNHNNHKMEPLPVALYPGWVPDITHIDSETALRYFIQQISNLLLIHSIVIIPSVDDTGHALPSGSNDVPRRKSSLSHEIFPLNHHLPRLPTPPIHDEPISHQPQLSPISGVPNGATTIFSEPNNHHHHHHHHYHHHQHHNGSPHHPRTPCALKEDHFAVSPLVSLSGSPTNNSQANYHHQVNPHHNSISATSRRRSHPSRWQLEFEASYVADVILGADPAPLMLSPPFDDRDKNQNNHDTTNNNNNDNTTTTTTNNNNDPKDESIIITEENISDNCNGEGDHNKPEDDNHDRPLDDKNEDRKQQIYQLSRRFWTRSTPGISIGDYLRRIHKYCPLSTSAYISTSLYIHRICVVDRMIPLTEYNVHRLVLASLRVACKSTEDILHTQKKFCLISGISSDDLLKIEVALLFITDFNISVDHMALQDQLEIMALLQKRTDDIRDHVNDRNKYKHKHTYECEFESESHELHIKKRGLDSGSNQHVPVLPESPNQ